jgi:hypothetical protein
MSFKILLVIAEDPRASGRPAEAVRIAAGVGAWKKVEVALYLRGAAVRLLGEDAAELVEGESYARYLPLLARAGAPVYVEKGTPELARLGRAALAFEAISDGQLAELAAGRGCVLRF